LDETTGLAKVDKDKDTKSAKKDEKKKGAAPKKTK